jgi:hypothetical protein
LPLSVSKQQGFRQRAFSVDWEADSLHTGSFSCSPTLSFSSGFETPSLSPAEGLRCDYSSVERSQGRTTLVASSPERLEWSSAPAPVSRPSHRDGRFVARLGSGLPGGENRRFVVTNGEQAPHQLFGTAGGFLRCEELYKGPIMCPCETSHGQHFGCRICESVRGNTLTGPLQFGACPVGMG